MSFLNTVLTIVESAVVLGIGAAGVGFFGSLIVGMFKSGSRHKHA